MPCGQAGAFTLVELLVVIAIIMLLVSLLMPSLRNAVSLTREAVCRSNLHQIVTGHAAYATAHTGWHPPSSTNPEQPHWLDLMVQYCGKSDDVRFCPTPEGYLTADPNNSSKSQVWGSRAHHWWLNKNTYGVESHKGGSYGANSWMHSTSGWGSNIDLHFKRTSEPERPAEVPVVTDSVWHNGFPADGNTPGTVEAYGGQPPGGQINRVAINRHRRGIYSGFSDGSADWVRLEKLWTLTWHKGFERIPSVTYPWLGP